MLSHLHAGVSKFCSNRTGSGRFDEKRGQIFFYFFILASLDWNFNIFLVLSYGDTKKVKNNN